MHWGRAVLLNPKCLNTMAKWLLGARGTSRAPRFFFLIFSVLNHTGSRSARKQNYLLRVLRELRGESIFFALFAAGCQQITRAAQDPREAIRRRSRFPPDAVRERPRKDISQRKINRLQEIKAIYKKNKKHKKDKTILQQIQDVEWKIGCMFWSVFLHLVSSFICRFVSTAVSTKTRGRPVTVNPLLNFRFSTG